MTTVSQIASKSEAIAFRRVLKQVLRQTRWQRLSLQLRRFKMSGLSLESDAGHRAWSRFHELDTKLLDICDCCTRGLKGHTIRDFDLAFRELISLAHAVDPESLIVPLLFPGVV